jgi:glycine/serine hydroxymethyltransferase
MKRVSALIVRVLTDIEDRELRLKVSREVGELCRRFPLPGVDDS